MISMRRSLFLLILLFSTGCSYDKPRAQAGVWTAKINGTNIKVEIVTNADGQHDILTTHVNGNVVHYSGAFDGEHFTGRQADTPIARVKNTAGDVGLWTLAEINRDGNLVCKMLVTSQIPTDTILTKTRDTR